MDKLSEEKVKEGEYYFLLSMILLGSSILVSTRNIFTMFISLELMSMSLYGIIGINRAKESSEAALKYFLLSSLASIFIVFSLGFIYVSASSLELNKIRETLLLPNYDLTLIIGLLFLMTGFIFKIALVPFHLWVADIYYGSPSQVSALMSSLIKVSGIIVLFRIYSYCHVPAIERTLVFFSGLTMIISNLMALPQKNIKRILAYSSISHSGYIILGFFTNDYWQVFYYILVYSIATFGAFSSVLLLEKNQKGIELDDIKGLFYKSPFISGLFSIFILSLASIPPMAGFFGKFYLFLNAINNGHSGLVLIAVITSIISLYYYLRIITSMFEPSNEETTNNISYNNLLNIFIFAILTLILGVFSNRIISLLKFSVLFN
jgi:NADH-quinone oxidoreductase subunit N